MALVASPYGLIPAGLIGGQVYAGNVRKFSLTSDVAAMGFGTVMSMASGVPTPAAATPTTTVGTSTPIGIFVGVDYDDPVMNYRINNNYLPANATTAGYKNIVVHIADDPDLIMQVQASSTTASAFTNAVIGSNVPLGTFTVNSTTHKSNTVALGASIATTSTLALRIVGYLNDQPYDATLNPIPDVLVKWNFGVHSYYNSTGM